MNIINTMDHIVFGPNGPHAHPVKYIRTYIKGKSKKPPLGRYRFEVENLDGKKYLFFWDPDSYKGQPKTPGMPNFGSQLNFIDWQYIDDSDPSHLRFKNYNYYLVGHDPQHVHDTFDAYLKSNPLISFPGEIGKGEYDKMKGTSDYKYVANFNGKTY